MKEFTVVKFIAESKPNWNLEKGKLYAVETDEDLVDIFDDGTITVWNDEGHLAEMYDGEYEIVIVDEDEWFIVKPESTFIEMY